MLRRLGQPAGCGAVHVCCVVLLSGASKPSLDGPSFRDVATRSGRLTVTSMLTAVLPRCKFLEAHSEVRAKLQCRLGRLKAGLI